MNGAATSSSQPCAGNLRPGFRQRCPKAIDVYWQPWSE